MNNSQLSEITEPVSANNSQIVNLKNSYITNKLTNSNALLKFGQPILILCAKIMQGNLPQELSIFKLTVTNEINIFINKCKSAKINNLSVSLAKYILINTIKDILIDQDIEFDLMEHKTLLKDSFSENLNSILKEPHKNIDLLELLFICYKFGFKDNYLIEHNLALEQQNQIYFAIRSVKGNISKNLYDIPMNNINLESTPSKKTFKYSSILLVVGILGIFITTISFHQNINLINYQVEKGISKIRQHL
ncbi:MAG: DotU family type IV/VI secretion system protein [Legionellales bacterium]|nr:DotU family type IV/VI secretion system protein [Legionellales bacterium]